MRYEDRSFETISDLLLKLKEDLAPLDGLPFWYRGQSQSEWKLIPKLYRVSRSRSELFLINRFIQNATNLLRLNPSSAFEWLFLMQHHGLPTRLLDWSESPLVALYFAVRKNDDKDGALWVLLPTILNKKSNYRPDYDNEIPSFDEELLHSYSPESVASEHRSKLFPVAAIAPRNSSRMQAQQGVFTINHREETPVESIGDPGSPQDYIWRYIIPADKKNTFRNELQILGFTRFQLFPELDSLASL